MNEHRIFFTDVYKQYMQECHVHQQQGHMHICTYIYIIMYIYICIQLYNIIHMHVRFPSETTIPCWDSKASIWTISHLQNMKAHLDHQSFLRWNKPNLFKPTTHSYYWFIVYILCLYHSHFMVEPC